MPDAFTIPADVVTLADYERHARTRLSDQAWAYIAGGAGDEITLRGNRAAFDAIRLKGRVLGAGGAGDGTRVTLFGDTYAHPILLAPVAHHCLASPAGELATAVGAAGARAGFVVSTESDTSVETIAAAAPGAPFWFQIHIQHDRAFTHALVARAEAAGAKAIVLTADAPVSGMRDRERHAGVTPAALGEPLHLRGARPGPMPRAGLGESLLFNGFIESVPSWADLARLRSITRLPLLIKGVMAPEDATRAIAEGVDGIIVSNHGGRVLDTLPPTIEALPSIAEAVDGRVPVIMDGGIRRGTDVLKALALGASAVMIGRPYIHGLAVAGPAGVAHVVQILRAEFEVAMVLTGCRGLRDIGPGVVWDQGQPVRRHIP